VPLREGTGDAEYLEALNTHLPMVLDRAGADIAFYLAGVDVAQGDRFGKLALTEDGIRRRDRLVASAVRQRRTPLVLLAGGRLCLHAGAHRGASCARFSRGAGAGAQRPVTQGVCDSRSQALLSAQWAIGACYLKFKLP